MGYGFRFGFFKVGIFYFWFIVVFDFFLFFSFLNVKRSNEYLCSIVIRGNKLIDEVFL